MKTTMRGTMTTFTTPTDWKSEKWWRNRSKDERLYHLNVPPRWKDINYSDLDMDKAVLEQASEWVSKFTPGDSLFVSGRSGSGKTVLAQALAKTLVAKKDLSGKFLASERYIEMLQDTFDNNNVLPEMYSTPHLLKYIQGVFDIVLLDGVGQERDTEFTRHEIGSLIRRRYENKRSVIITTSFSQMDFVRRYGDRVKLALSEMATIKIS